MRLPRFYPTAVLVAALVAPSAGCSLDGSRPEAGEVLQPAVASDTATAVTFACTSGREITVSYPDSASIRLGYLGQDYTLAQVPAGTGARYAGADLDWSGTVRNGEAAFVLSRVSPVGSSTAVVLERCARPVGTPAVIPVQADPAPTAPVSAPPCKGPQLQLDDAGGDAGMGNRVAIVGVRNMGTAACSLTGYPSITLVDDRSQALTRVRTEAVPGSYFRSGQTASAVILVSRGRAWFDVAWNVVPQEADGEAACPTAARIRMTAPNDTSPVWLDRRLTPCGGLIRVTPFRAVAEPVPSPS
ncbi:DUF4232 domain-containing protein [uncultured Brevundimonas sp.]|uniref:DUF4232 domain-containing protein n=1 Tax=uncultured Brevundimonas sp. TaxID=213418 RepID=UPI0030ED1613|tara:strand:+ start:119 stop:1021 length:903 start_codon:yes stop_codon:yes gene_type:complete